MPEVAGRQMAAEMAEQPGVVAGLLARRDEIAAVTGPLLAPPPRGVVLVARGSSDNAATYGKYVLELALGVPVALGAPSIFTRYRRPQSLDGYLAVGLSQSGQTPEVVASLERMRGFGARTVAITNDPRSRLAAVADAHIALDAGAEKAVPATKTFTAQVAALALLATTVQPGLVAETEWRAAIEGLREVLAAEQDMTAATEAVASSATTLCIARGLLYGAALECALKLSETTGRSVTGISAADLLHGPIAMVNERSSVIGLAAATPGRRDLDEAAAKAMTRGASYISIGPPGTAPPSSGGIRVHVPAVAEILTILVHTVRAQQLARGLALRDGLDPDRPQGLTKVTPTG